MTRWNALFDEYRTHEAERLETERRVRDFEHWCRSAVESVLGELSTRAEQKSEELALHAGVRVVVHPPRKATARYPRAEVTYFELRREQDVLYLYAYSERGHLPLMHFLMPAHEGFLERARHPRLLSLPGCRLRPTADGGVELERIQLDGVLSTESMLTVDDLVYRAFELLLRARCAKRAGNVELSPPSSGPETHARA